MVKHGGGQKRRSKMAGAGAGERPDLAELLGEGQKRWSKTVVKHGGQKRWSNTAVKRRAGDLAQLLGEGAGVAVGGGEAPREGDALRHALRHHPAHALQLVKRVVEKINQNVVKMWSNDTPSVTTRPTRSSCRRPNGGGSNGGGRPPPHNALDRTHTRIS